jgi:hypothetical protein
MTLNPSLRVTIEFDDPELEPEERDKQAQRLIAELRDLNDVETVERVADSNLSEGTKSIGGFLVGFLKDRLGGKLIEFTVEANGKKLTAKASSREELDYAIAKANDFIEKWQ